MLLKGKIAIVTGGSRGIGFATVEAFLAEGATVVLCGSRPESAQKAVAQIKERDPHAAVSGISPDLACYDQVKDAFDAVAEQYGRIDILVNNAGVCRLANFLDMTDEDRDFHIDVNIKGIWNTTRAVLPVMIENGYGKIVNMSSVTGPLVADEGETAYAMSKAAIYGFTKALARETAKYKINVNMIMPGYVMTPMAQSIAVQSCPEDPDSVIRGIESGVPLGRLADPKEVGHLAAFLASDDAAYLTGTQVVIDGGSTLPETVSVGA